jgi:tripartite-type tricarboxylate transporter receptor subunit TctC
VREGRIRALALTAAQRTPFDPDVPTIADSGFPGYSATNWYALVTSSKVPRDTIAALNALLTKALNAPEVRAAYAQQGMVTIAGTVEQAVAYIARETEVWKKLIADTGIRFD